MISTDRKVVFFDFRVSPFYMQKVAGRDTINNMYTKCCLIVKRTHPWGESKTKNDVDQKRGEANE